MGFYSMPRYFEHMPQVGKPMKKANPENEAQLKAIQAEIHELVKAAQSAGRSDESLNESGDRKSTRLNSSHPSSSRMPSSA